MKNTHQPSTLAYSKLIGTPYSEKDCWGIALEFYKSVFGVELPSYYSEVPKTRDSAKALVYSYVNDFEKVDDKDIAFGDLILIKLHGVESHIAVYLGEDRMLHTTHHSGCVVDRLLRYKHLVVGFYRVKKS